MQYVKVPYLTVSWYMPVFGAAYLPAAALAASVLTPIITAAISGSSRSSRASKAQRYKTYTKPKRRSKKSPSYRGTSSYKRVSHSSQFSRAGIRNNW